MKKRFLNRVFAGILASVLAFQSIGLPVKAEDYHLEDLDELIESEEQINVLEEISEKSEEEDNSDAFEQETDVAIEEEDNSEAFEQETDVAIEEEDNSDAFEQETDVSTEEEITYEFMNSYIDDNFVIYEGQKLSGEEYECIEYAEIIPDSYSSVDYGYVTPIKSQGRYGTCWSFASTGVVESAALVAEIYDDPTEVDFSERTIAYNTYHREGINDPLGNTLGDYMQITGIIDGKEDNWANRGGNFMMAAFHMLNWQGPENESKVPYGNMPEVVDSSCFYDSEVHLQSVEILSNGTDYNSTDVKQEIMEHGAVAASYYSGYENDREGTIYTPANYGTNHAVMIVGWDDNYSKENFDYTPSQDGAWLIKNSWGTYFGVNGYYWMSYEDKSLQNLYSVTVESADNYDHNFFYDGGYCNSTIRGLKSVANIYQNTLDDQQKISAIGFGNSTTNCAFSIQIYKNPTSRTNPASGKALLSTPQKGTFTHAGYYTVPLDEEITVDPGDKFSVVITYEANGAPWLDVGGDFSDVTYFTEEVSESSFYLFSANSSWFDCSSNEYTVRIKAYTNDVTDERTLEQQFKWNGTVITGFNTNYLETEDLVIPEKATEIADYAFANNANIKSVTYYGDSKLTTIGEGAFQNCYNIEYVELPETVTTVELNSFQLCGNFGEEVTLICDRNHYFYVNDAVAEKIRAFVKYVETDDLATDFYKNECFHNHYYVNDECISYAHFILHYDMNLPEGATIKNFEEIEDQNCVVGKNFICKANTYEIAKYEFVGWNTKADGSGENIAQESMYCFTSAEDNQIITWYAQWSEIVYQITLDPQGGSISNNTITVKYEYPYGELPIPEKEGYIFVGWYFDAEGNQEVTETTIVSSKETHTLYACWGDKYCQIELNSNGGEILENTSDFDTYGISSLGISEDGNLQLSVIANKILDPSIYVKREGYRLVGWYTDPLAGEKIDFSKQIKEDVVAYARWKEIVYVSTPALTISDETKIIARNDEFLHYVVYGNTEIQLSSELEDSSIYYITSDEISAAEVANFDFIKNGHLYLEPIVLDHDVTLYAIAVKEGYDNSEVFKVVFRVHGGLWGDITYLDRLELAKTFQIDVADLTPDMIPQELWIAGIYDMTYSGVEVTFPDMHVYWNSHLLVSGIDYSVKYTNNKNAVLESTLPAKRPAVTITGRGNYQGTITHYFMINPVDISQDGLINAPNIALIENGRVQKGTTTVTCSLNGSVILLKNGTDYNFVYPKTDARQNDYDPLWFSKANGEGNEDGYEVQIVAKGNYTGTVTFHEIILPRQTDIITVNKLSVTAISNKTYTGEQITLNKDSEHPDFIVKNGRDIVPADCYTISYRSNVEIGTAYVIIEGNQEKGYVGSKVVSFKIVGIPISKATITGLISTKTFTGSEIKQDLHLAISNGKNVSATSLKEGDDYTVQYQNNVKTGTATVIITGKGLYTGVVKKTFKIVAYSIDVSKDFDNRITVLPIDVIAYQKNGAKPVVTVIDNMGTLEDTDDRILVEGVDYTLRYSNNTVITTSATIKKPTVTISGKGNYSGSRVEYFIIEKSSLDVVVASATDIVYQNKAGICKPTITLVDTNGNKLTSGVDYNKNINYTYANPTRIVRYQNGVRKEIIVPATQKVESSDIIPVGTVIYAKIYGLNNYIGSNKIVSFRYVTGSVANAKVTIPIQSYTGQEIELLKEDINIKIGSHVLTEDDFEIVGYSNNVNKGTAEVTIRGVGTCGGVKTVTFKIGANSIDKYTVIFGSNYATSGTLNNFIIKVTEEKALPANKFARVGYIFVGWNTMPDGSGTSYQDKEIISGINNGGKTLHLYAQWEKIVN